MRTTHIVAIVLLALGLGGCHKNTTAPNPSGITLNFISTEIPSAVDSTAYARVAGPGRIDLVGFYTDCSYTLEGRRPSSDLPNLVLEIDVYSKPILCFRGRSTRYLGAISGVSPGEHRVFLVHVVRDSDTGELINASTVLDTVLTVPES